MALRAQTVDKENRSIEATLTTERKTLIRDPCTYRPIDEIILADAVHWVRHVVLLDTHDRWSVDHVLGSIRDIRRDQKTWVGRLVLARDDKSEAAWSKLVDGHLRAVSVGYLQRKYVDIPARETQTVRGVSYTAGPRTLRITTDALVQEVSLTPIGADRGTMTRSDANHSNREPTAMDPALRTYLQSIGLAADATDEAANEFHEGLRGAQRARADGIANGTIRPAPDPEPAAQRTAPAATPPNPEPPAQRNDTPPPGDPPAPPPDLAAIRAEAAAAERTRQTRIRELAGDAVSAELVTRAIDEGWDEDAARRHFYDDLRQRRGPGVDGRAPAGHTRSHDTECTREALAMSIAIRAGVDPLDIGPPTNVQNEIDDLVPGYGDARRHQLEQLAHRSDRFRDLSVLDLCRESIRIDGQRVPHGRHEAIRAAVSGGTLAYIFTTSLNARLQRSYQEAEDSTVDWVSVDNTIPDFKTNERARMAAGANLEKLGRGGTAKHDKPSDTRETYKVARYAKMLTVDEQDIIDDNLGAITSQPIRMGAAARRLRPDLVYSILLANAALADTGLLFNNTAVTTDGGHANLTTAALAAAALKAGIVAMAKQKDGNAQLNIAPRFLIVPQDLVFTARELVNSALIVLAGNTDTERGNRNVLSDLDLQIRADNSHWTWSHLQSHHTTPHP